MKKFLSIAIVVFVIFFIAYKPSAAATVVRTIGGGIVNILTGVGSFFSNLVS